MTSLEIALICMEREKMRESGSEPGPIDYDVDADDIPGAEADTVVKSLYPCRWNVGGTEGLTLKSQYGTVFRIRPLDLLDSEIHRIRVALDEFEQALLEISIEHYMIRECDCCGEFVPTDDMVILEDYQYCKDCQDAESEREHEREEMAGRRV